jgi:prophage tail gpP-like protein
MILKINDRIRNRNVEFFNNFTLSLKYDSVASAFNFNFYFNPDTIELKELACIGHYHIASIEHNGELLLTGYILSEAFSSEPEKKMVAMGGYSLPGVLEDCEIPTDLYPLQSDGLSLKEIARKLTSLFDFKTVIDPAVASKMNQVFEKTTAGAGGSIKQYLTDLAAQKNIVISHTEKGELLFTEAKTKAKPFFHFENNVIGTTMSLSFNGQAMHSHITVIKQADADEGNAGEFTIRNPYVPFVYRPKVIVQSSGDDNDTEKAARNALSQELKNLVLTITTDRWEVDGKIIKPNSIITIKNPEIYLYNKCSWFVEGVEYQGDNTKMTATLTCVLPEVYNMETPEYLFKGINLH